MSGHDLLGADFAGKTVDCSLSAGSRFRPGFWYKLGPNFSVILQLYLIRKFPGLFGHPLTD